jgi:glycosyltransferase involved in cell wall biosynthesis
MLVFLCPGFPENENDTTCLPTVQRFMLSVKKQVPPEQFIVLSFQYPFVRREYVWHGIRVIAMGGKNKPGLLRFINWLKIIRQLNNIHKREGISGFLSFWMGECALVGKYYSNKIKVKHYTWLQGQDVKSDNRYVKLVKPAADQVIAISERSALLFYRNHAIKPFKILENGIIEESFPDLNIGERSIDIMGAGSLAPLKQYGLFIEIIFEVIKTYPDIKVVLAGDGPQKHEIGYMIKNLNLSGNITLTGKIPQPEVLALMNRCKIFLHSSSFEGSPAVLHEALYSGCSVVAFDYGLNQATKRLYCVPNREQMVEVLLNLLSEWPAAERVTYHKMDRTATHVISLFGM